MATPIKESILANLESVIGAAAHTQDVYRGKSVSLDLNNLPAVIIYEIGDTVEERETNLLLTKQLNVFIEYWTEAWDTESPPLDLDSSLTQYEAELSDAIMSDNSRGGYARFTELSDSRRILVEDDGTIGGGVLSILISYSVNEENPYSAM